MSPPAVPPPASSAAGTVTRRLWDLAAPIIGLNVLNVLSLAVDTAMCGRLPNKDVVLAALGYSVQILFLLQVAMFGLSIGCVATVSRAFGAGDGARVDHILAQSVTMTVIVSGAIAIVGNLAAPTLVHALGGNDLVTAEALRFLRPLLSCTVFTYLILLLAAVLRGVGNSQLAFRVALLQNGLNVAINLVLINGQFGLPGLGAQGAAIGTASSQAIAVFVLVWQLRGGAVPGVHFAPRLVRPDLALARQLWRIGAPAALDMVILNASFISLVAMLGRIDNHAVAAHGIGLRIQALAFVPGMSVSQAAGALVGQALGRRQPDVARATYAAAVKLCLLIMGSLSAIVFLTAPWIVRVFDVQPDSAVGAYAITWMRVLGVGMPVVSIWIATSGLLQGAGDTKASLRINLIATLLVQIPASYLLGFTFDLGTFGVWLGLPIAAIARSVQGTLYVRSGAWEFAGGRGR